GRFGARGRGPPAAAAAIAAAPAAVAAARAAAAGSDARLHPSLLLRAPAAIGCRHADDPPHRGIARARRPGAPYRRRVALAPGPRLGRDRKSTRLNSSHGSISYAVFCLKKKKKKEDKSHNTKTRPRQQRTNDTTNHSTRTTA